MWPFYDAAVCATVKVLSDSSIVPLPAYLPSLLEDPVLVMTAKPSKFAGNRATNDEDPSINAAHPRT